ncbi:hypothetical protein HZY88_06610 [Aerococcaceae bacterium DSM 111176]|nr:hypothetical protein [Aerococcaceae bacterium DSM 111176]
MFKKTPQLLTLIIISLLLVGCQQIMDDTQNPSNSLSSEEASQIYNQDKMILAMNNHLESLDQSQSTIQTTFTFEDLEMVKSQENFESYQDLSLSGYEIQTTVSDDGEILNEQFVWDDAGYHTQFHNEPFITTDQTNRQPYVYLNFLQFLVASDDTWIVEDIDENTAKVTKEFADPEMARELGLFIDLPVIVSPNAEYEIAIEYLMDKELGVINSGTVNGTVKDLGKFFQVTHELVETQFNENAESLNIDFEEEADNNNDDFVTQFNSANPIDLITNYDMQLIRTENGETIEEQFISANTLRQSPYMELIAPLVEEGIGSFGTVYENTYYYVDNDDVQSTDRNLFNAYSHFVQRIIEQHDQLAPVESGDSNILYYREIFGDDFSALTEAVGDAHIDQFSNEENNLYGIDYIIDNNSKRLLNAVIWNGSDQSEVIDTTTGYYFGDLNLHTPSLLGGQIDQSIWDEMIN